MFSTLIKPAPKSKEVLAAELSVAVIDTDRIDRITDLKDDLSIINYNLSRLDVGGRFYDHVLINGLDNNYLHMLNNQFDFLAIIDRELVDFKGLTNRGIEELATEGIVDFMKTVLTNIWEYIKKVAKSISDFITGFFSDTKREHVESLVTQFKTVFNMNLGDNDLSKIRIQSPNPELIGPRFVFYSKAIDLLIQLHNNFSEDLNLADDHPYTELKKLLGLIDSKKTSGVRIDTIVKKLEISKPTNGLYSLKEFKDSLGSEFNNVLDLLLNLTESYKKQLDVVGSVKSECDIQISELKKTNTIDNDPNLKKKASYYTSLCVLMNLININLIHDHHLFINTMNDAVKKVDSYKRQNLGK